MMLPEVSPCPRSIEHEPNVGIRPEQQRRNKLGRRRCQTVSTSPDTLGHMLTDVPLRRTAQREFGAFLLLATDQLITKAAAHRSGRALAAPIS